MIAFVDAVNAQMYLSAAGHLYGHCFAKKEIGISTQDLHRINRVVIGYGYNGHAKLLEPLIHFRRVVVGLSTETVQAGDVEHSGSHRVNVEVASHGFILSRRYEQSVKRRRILRECAHGTG